MHRPTVFYQGSTWIIGGFLYRDQGMDRRRLLKFWPVQTIRQIAVRSWPIVRQQQVFT